MAQKKFNTVQDAIEYLQTLPFNALINIAAEALFAVQQAQAPRKITITEEQFREHFKIAGITETGEKETRGRKRKND